jgi:hypothetical protein
MVGAEFDMLSNEARQTISDIAGLDKREREDGMYEFEQDTYKWTLARDVRHGFTHDDGRQREGRRDYALEKNTGDDRASGRMALQGTFC